ncbi:hypothetical protein ACGIF2_01745 [Cellulomonas sp. P22]|uniref:hypothetical protein n=1 Tax=Cellulomonas sp. P22 TaxID=3373189 RepID=UPI0037B4F8B5
MTTATTQPRSAPRTLGGASLVGLATVLAWLLIGAGAFVVVQVVSGTMVAEVPVRLGPGTPAYESVVLPCVEGWSREVGSGCAPAATAEQWPGGAALPVDHDGGMVATGYDASWTTALLADAGTWALLLAGGVVVLILVPVLRSTAAGRPFAPHNGRRLAVAASVTAAACLLATAGPYLAAPEVIALLEAARVAPDSAITLPDGWLVPQLRVTWWPALVATLLLVLAAATRTGARLADDAEGLV